MNREVPSPAPAASRTPEKTGSLLGLVAQALFGLATVVSLIVGVTLWLAPKPKETEGLPVLGSTVLADGTTVSVVAITVGPRHSLTFPLPEQSRWDRFWGTKRFDKIDTHSGDSGLMIWTTRRQPGSEALVVFETLREGRLELAPDRSLRHTNVHQYIRGQHGSSGSSGTPPFTSSRPSHPSDIVVTNLAFPVVADPGQPVQLRLLGEKGVELGVVELTLPPSILPKPSGLAPLPLPQTAGTPYAVTLTDLDPRETGDGRVTLRPKLEVSRDGKKLSAVTFNIGMVKDPLGNTAGTYECGLDRTATAWEMPVTAQIRVDPQEEPDAQWTSPPLPLPGAISGTVALDVTGEMRGGRTRIHLARFCGPKCAPLGLLSAAAAAGSSNWGYSTSALGKDLRVEVKEVGGMRGVEVQAEFPFVYAESPASPLGERLVLVSVVDDQSRAAKFHPFEHQGVLLYLVDALPDAKSVTLTFAIDRLVNVEFRFAPPPTPPSPPTKP